MSPGPEIEPETEPELETALAQALQAHLAGQLDAAAQAYQELIARAPGQVELLYRYGLLQMQRRRVEAGVALLHRAAAAAPEHAGIRFHLGIALLELARPEAALSELEAARALRPADPEIQLQLGHAQHQSGSSPAAMASYREAVRLFEALPPASRPRALLGQAWYSIAKLLLELRQLGAALPALQAALRLLPDQVQIRIDLAESLMRRGWPEAAFAHYRQAMAMAPDDLRLASDSLYCLLLVPGIDAATRAAAFRDWGERVTARTQALPPPVPAAPKRRLRLGYLGTGLRDHSSSSVIMPLYRERDSGAFEVYSYANLLRPDDVTALYRSLSDRWQEVQDWSDRKLAEQIRADGIDILIDLDGHTVHNRLACLAYRPAPVQLGGLGFGGQLGLAAIDYRLADIGQVPPEQDGQPDRLWYLPLAFSYTPPAAAPAPQPGPRHHNGFITFGSGNSIVKFNEQMLAAWARILTVCPGSRLRLKSFEYGDRLICRELYARFARLGITPDRIDMIGRSDHAGQLAYYHSLDIALDPFPYDGGISTCEALWMGVPLISLDAEGQRCGSRLLGRLDLHDWLAPDVEAYIELARRKAADGDSLDALRQSLRPRLAASEICNSRAYVQAVESAYRAIWAEYLARR